MRFFAIWLKNVENGAFTAVSRHNIIRPRREVINLILFPDTKSYFFLIQIILFPDSIFKNFVYNLEDKEQFMAKKSIILAIVLLTAGLAVVQAQETVTNEVTAVQYGTGQMFLNLTPLAYPESVGGKLGMGFLNIFLGLGSWISGDWESGLMITIYQGGGIAVAILGISWGTSMDPVEALLFGWIPIVLVISGVALWVSGVITGFAAPFKEPKTMKINDYRNWTVALFPTPNRSVAGVLAFTAHF
jgi:hypothetical protein